MATKGKEGHPGREMRKGISSSQRKSSAAAGSKLVPPTKVNDSKNTPDRNVPNYLKPTYSASRDSSDSKQPPVKKAVSAGDNLNNKPASYRDAVRRRSLDRPQQASPVPKPRVSSTSREGSNARSSSLTPRTATLPHKAPSDRLSKGPKDAGGKDQSSRPRPVSTVRKSSLNGKKQETESSASSKAARRTSPPSEAILPVADITVPEPQEDLGASLTEADEAMLNAGNGSAVLDKLIPFENQVHDYNPTQAAAEPIKGEEIDQLQIVEPSIVTKHPDENVNYDGIEEPEDKLQDGEITCKDVQVEEHGGVETVTEYSSQIKESSDQSGNPFDSNCHAEEEVAQGPIPEVENMEDRHASEAHSDQILEEEEVNNIVKSKFIDSPEKEEVSNVNKSIDSPQKEVASVAEVKQAMDKTTTKPEVVQGKRDAAVVSNGVIEETASKLREQRKNKVKALAGAFETVISLQESK